MGEGGTRINVDMVTDRCYIDTMIESEVEQMSEYRTSRINVRVSEQLNDWYTEESKRTGISKSTLMHIAANEYMDSKKRSRLKEEQNGVIQND